MTNAGHPPTPQYGETAYWEERYTIQPSIYDWYQGYLGLQTLLLKYIQQAHSILHVGMGTSRLQEDMVQQGGYRSIKNIDISSVAVKRMSELHKGIPELQYEVADARHMPQFADESFDAVLDKGTMDALLCCGAGAFHSTGSLVCECYRVLKQGGVFMLVTYGSPSTRLPRLILPGLDWTIHLYCLSRVDDDFSGPGMVSCQPPIIRGPFKVDEESSLKALEDLQRAHFVYVCLKSPTAEPLGPDTQAAILGALAAAAASAAGAAAEVVCKEADPADAELGKGKDGNAAGAAAPVVNGQQV